MARRTIGDIKMQASKAGKPYAVVTFADGGNPPKASCWHKETWEALYDFIQKEVDIILTSNDKGYWNIDRLGSEVPPAAVNPSFGGHTVSQPAYNTRKGQDKDWDKINSEKREYWEKVNKDQSEDIHKQVVFKLAGELVAAKNCVSSALPEDEVLRLATELWKKWIIFKVEAKE